MMPSTTQQFSRDDYEQFCDEVGATANSYYEEGLGFSVEFKFGETVYTLFGTSELAWFRCSDNKIRAPEFTFKFNRIKYHPRSDKASLVFVCFVEADENREHPRLLLYCNLEDGFYRVVTLSIQGDEGEFKFPKQM